MCYLSSRDTHLTVLELIRGERCAIPRPPAQQSTAERRSSGSEHQKTVPNQPRRRSCREHWREKASQRRLSISCDTTPNWTEAGDLSVAATPFCPALHLLIRAKQVHFGNLQ